MDLTDAERLLLDFEREWWQLPASKMSEIRTRFGFSASRYYRSLHSLIDRPDAEASDPLTVLGVGFVLIVAIGPSALLAPERASCRSLVRFTASVVDVEAA